jgi:hypothetical protein
VTQPTTFQRNLVALSLWDGETAESIHDAAPAALDWPDDAEVARRRDACTAAINVAITYSVIVMGAGFGEFAAVLKRMDVGRVKRSFFHSYDHHGANCFFYPPVVVYEPDLSRVRAVLERVDLGVSATRLPIVFLASPDQASLASAFARFYDMVTMGTYIVDVPDYAPEGRVELMESLIPFADAASLITQSNMRLGGGRSPPAWKLRMEELKLRRSLGLDATGAIRHLWEEECPPTEGVCRP